MRASLSAAILCLLPLGCEAHKFKPDNGVLLSHGLDTLPTPYDILESQTESFASSGNSFWSSSFIHGLDNHDYLVVSHVLGGFPITPSMYRGSILDITDTSRYFQFEVFSNVSNLYSDTGDFNATYSNYGFAMVDRDDTTATMRTWSSIDGAEFDLTFYLSSPALLNGGLGTWDILNNSVKEWGMPAGKTTGWLSMNGEKVAVDIENSLTWYDRQVGGAPAAWTWFELHMDCGQPGSTTALAFSVWVWNDTVDGSGGIATVREATGASRVVPIASLVASDRTYTSNATNAVYPLDWVLKLADETEFYISSVRDDQEMHAPGGGFPTYEGFITVTGVYKGSTRMGGYGLVEISPLSSS